MPRACVPALALEQGLGSLARSLHPPHPAAPEWPLEKQTMGDEGNMDAKKLTGALLALALTASIVATAEAETLAMIEIGLVGMLYVLRRRRQTAKDLPRPRSVLNALPSSAHRAPASLRVTASHRVPASHSAHASARAPTMAAAPTRHR